jgi:hypothetical protein
MLKSEDMGRLENLPYRGGRLREMLAELGQRCNTIEECYEFMLAYAAQGLPSDEEFEAGGQIRDCLELAAAAISGLAESCSMVVKEERIEPAEQYQTFFRIIDRDARDSLAAIELVLAQPFISSQLIDNLNASIHLRALLTDLFLVNEIFRTHNTNQYYQQ